KSVDVSPDGRYVAINAVEALFPLTHSDATVVAVYDRETGRIDVDGAQGGKSAGVAINAGGRFVSLGAGINAAGTAPTPPIAVDRRLFQRCLFRRRPRSFRGFPIFSAL